MADTTDTRSDGDRATSAAAGRIGLVGVAVLAVVLGLHPSGTTALYDDPIGFLDHVDGGWFAIHLVAAISMLVIPLIVGTWARSLPAGAARAWGQLATLATALGAALGALHLLGPDTMTWLAYQSSWSADPSPAALVGADVLLRLHAASLLAWTTVFSVTGPGLLAVAAALDRDQPRWLSLVAGLGAALVAAGVIVTVSQGQWTTLSDQVLLRTGSTFTVVVVVAVANGLRLGTGPTFAKSTGD